MAVSPFTIASGQVPDVLATLAQLPNDEVFTPPTLVNAMLDVLPEEVWSNHTYRWLDPATKSGVFLRETYKRLMIGLAKWEPDSSLRREHILKNMLFGAAITSLASELSRRSVYQTTDATGKRIKDDSIKDLIVEFPSPEGNIVYAPTEHTIVKGKCTICRAPEKLIRDRRESFAYSFIHGTYPTKEMQDMKFDVIVGNPPYQIGMDDGKGNRTANITPLYNMFVEKAIGMDPRYLVMITPSRWFAGGHSLSEYRDRMINDRRLRAIVDNPKLYDCFPEAKIEGGVSYFLWDRAYDGDCTFTTRVDGVIQSTVTRDLRAGQGVLLRDNFAAEIVEKITSDPFGQSLKTNFRDSRSEPFKDSIPLIYVNKIGYITSMQIERNHLWVSKFKVLIPKAFGDTKSEQLSVLGEPIALAPGSVSTQSYLVAGTFDSEIEARHYASYLTTKFVRFLVLQRKISQDMIPSRFAFVPMMDMSKAWTDELLYKMFKLKPEEIAYIERAIGPRDWIDSLDSPIPSTHLPGGRKFKAGDATEGTDDEDDE